MKDDEFFIGWQGKAPEGIGRFLRGRAWLGLLMAVMFAGVLAVAQETIGLGVFEFGNVREFSGVLVKEPVPMLVADEADEASGQSVYSLVNPFKHGFDAEAAEEFHLKAVKLKGTLIYQKADGQAMIEVASVTLEPDETAGRSPMEAEPLGTMTLRGEIVDSKCYLGVMNPGRLKAHRACAINCIRGGIPPVMLVQNEAGEANYFLLTDEKGGAVNAEVLEYVALPVEIEGEVERVGARLVLKAALENYRLLGE